MPERSIWLIAVVLSLNSLAALITTCAGAVIRSASFRMPLSMGWTPPHGIAVPR